MRISKKSIEELTVKKELLSINKFILDVECTAERMCYDRTYLVKTPIGQVKVVRNDFESTNDFYYALMSTSSIESIMDLDESNKIYYD